MKRKNEAAAVPLVLFPLDEDEEEQPLIAPQAVPGRLRRWAKDLRRPALGPYKTVSEGIWLAEKRLCKVTVPRGNDFKTMGFSVRGEMHLYPEEALFLMERCKLVVANLTAAQLYEMVDLGYYLVYAYFKQTSLIIFRADDKCTAPALAFKVYGSNANFSKRNPGPVLFYVMYGRTKDIMPTEELLRQVLAWTGVVPVKFAIVSDEGSVFPFNIANRHLSNDQAAALKPHKPAPLKRRKRQAQEDEEERVITAVVE